ncbi:hypothetical protein C7M84_010169 [Penaeus vannamei]|uniref:Uncharacterized protein n=1 Tax=Penaeus vannamei TaxID=6689 RepID=A0A423T556_PENVA|nr:hypothetical protein C7M84_010169 [Penaeus vannamei]
MILRYFFFTFLFFCIFSCLHSSSTISFSCASSHSPHCGSPFSSSFSFFPSLLFLFLPPPFPRPFPLLSSPSGHSSPNAPSFSSFLLPFGHAYFLAPFPPLSLSHYPLALFSSCLVSSFLLPSAFFPFSIFSVLSLPFFSLRPSPLFLPSPSFPFSPLSPLPPPPHLPPHKSGQRERLLLIILFLCFLHSTDLHNSSSLFLARFPSFLSPPLLPSFLSHSLLRPLAPSRPHLPLFLLASSSSSLPLSLFLFFFLPFLLALLSSPFPSYHPALISFSFTYFVSSSLASPSSSVPILPPIPVSPCPAPRPLPLPPFPSSPLPSPLLSSLPLLYSPDPSLLSTSLPLPPHSSLPSPWPLSFPVRLPLLPLLLSLPLLSLHSSPLSIPSPPHLSLSPPRPFTP